MLQVIYLFTKVYVHIIYWLSSFTISNYECKPITGAYWILKVQVITFKVHIGNIDIKNYLLKLKY